MPPSPLNIPHRHTDTNGDFEPLSPGTYGNEFPHSSSPPPRTATPPTPGTPRQQGMMNMNAPHRGSVDVDLTGTSADAGGGAGLGNLADELADAWEEEEGYGYGYGYASGQETDNGPVDSQQQDVSDGEEDYDMGGGGARTPSSGYSVEHNTLRPPRPKGRNAAQRHRRHESQYDGSDYGNDSDLEEAADISPSLEGQMAEIESLARRGMENNGSENDHVIKRTVEALRDLGGQSGIENNAMRLITAHTSITSHLTHQTRTLQTLTHPLLFSPFPLLSEDAIDALVPLIDTELLPNLPYPFQGQARHSSTTTSTPATSRPGTPHSHSHSHSRSHSQPQSHLNPLTSLQTLISQTSDLTHSLQGLSDTLYESRQLTSTASRRLRSARELVAELRREEEGREEGSRWLERGDWDRKLKEREAGRECGDVVSGFEAVCGEWRERLFGAGAGEVAAA
ncbi:hypothetical protein SI65_01638 [Aspergillus cristatus]|uniref:Uncharacterized protein n=1 Tax=Aspergillus cristatus TaxID=573508 RepID=A0A1E3BSW6_ASPCR|nr:hypothetical protein SI65_01638 [Aspergillus cristatus]